MPRHQTEKRKRENEADVHTKKNNGRKCGKKERVNEEIKKGYVVEKKRNLILLSVRVWSLSLARAVRTECLVTTGTRDNRDRKRKRWTARFAFGQGMREQVKTRAASVSPSAAGRLVTVRSRRETKTLRLVET